MSYIFIISIFCLLSKRILKNFIKVEMLKWSNIKNYPQKKAKES